LLSETGVEFEFRDLIASPPSEGELREIARLNSIELSQLVNPKSQAFKQLKPDLSKMDEQQIIGLIQGNPKLMVRPVLTDGQTSLIGFREAGFRDLLKMQ
jgi:arsenate reductase-like glutaredoxin family protein